MRKPSLRCLIQQIAFGDLFLEDIRAYRQQQLASLNIEPVFPLWGTPTDVLSREMVDGGLRVYLTCVDPKQCPKSFAGEIYAKDLLKRLPKTVDPCGENDEFHTFVYDGPMFTAGIDVTVGETIERDGFVFMDILPS